MESVTPLASKLILRFFTYKFYNRGVYFLQKSYFFHLFDNNSFTHDELGMFELSTNNFEYVFFPLK